MGGKIRQFKLRKVGVFYYLESDGKKYTFMIDDLGELTIYTNKSVTIKPYGDKTIIINQE